MKKRRGEERNEMAAAKSAKKKLSSGGRSGIEEAKSGGIWRSRLASKEIGESQLM
jgi:hypothetical protein